LYRLFNRNIGTVIARQLLAGPWATMREQAQQMPPEQRPRWVLEQEARLGLGAPDLPVEALQVVHRPPAYLVLAVGGTDDRDGSGCQGCGERVESCHGTGAWQEAGVPGRSRLIIQNCFKVKA